MTVVSYVVIAGALHIPIPEQIADCKKTSNDVHRLNLKVGTSNKGYDYNLLGHSIGTE